MTRIVIDRLRIEGLNGATPTRDAVEAAVRQALAGRGSAIVTQDQRITRPAGTTLSGAAQAAIEAAFGGRKR